MNTATMATQHIVQNLIFRQLRRTTTATLSLHRPNHPLPHRLHRRAVSLFCTLQQNADTATELNKTKDIEDDAEEKEDEVKTMRVLKTREVPELSVKERKEVGSYAHSLGDKLKEQQIGKSGVTGNVAFALDETLESKELVKLKIHRSCPGELEDIIRQLEQSTGSVVVGQIGRTVILYRPSVTKLKAEQKKEQNRKIFEQKRKKFLANPSVVQRWKK
ncbi:hypothetical protein vseg_018692 [Gypsophila vaccaria]